MISAIRRRELVDTLTAVAVRAMSLLVLAAVVGMLMQLLMAVLPLAQVPVLEPSTTTVRPIPLVGPASDSAPAWVPKQVAGAQWQVFNGHGMWFSIDEHGVLNGQVVKLSSENFGITDYAMPQLKVGPNAALGLVNSPRSSLLILEASGAYTFYDLWGNALYAGHTANYQTIHILPGNAGFLGVSRSNIDHWHWVRENEGPVFSLRQQMQFEGEVGDVVIDPAGERVLVVLGLKQLEIRSVLSGKQIVEMTLPEDPESVFWIDNQRFGVSFSQGQGSQARGSNWKIIGDIDQIDASRLFEPLVYPGYSQASSVWQPLSSTVGNPAKLNIVPLLVGTFKTAVLALIFAVPIATGAATFVGYFMAPRYRNRIKPVIEMIAAFPTVVIGAIFAVAVVPFFLGTLAQLLGALLVTPCAIALIAYVLHLNGGALSHTDKHSSLAIVLVLPGILVIALGAWIGLQVESHFFSGDLMAFLGVNIGLDYQSHNSLLVAIAMGFAIIPSVFTVAEDAINGVPRSLGSGSLALGASHWQTFSKVVLPVALPGIIAAVLLGFGRAIGETMILLMLSGNAAEAGFNPFTAVRSIAATLAIELPDAAVASAHFQVLVLAALMLFAVTFVFNTVAQVLKRRLLSRIGQIHS